jgi:hypothetical protein
MNAHNPMFPNDPLAEEIYELHMRVVATSKGYFCALFGHHSALEDAVTVFIENGETNLPFVVHMLTNDIQKSELPRELDSTLFEMLNLPCNGKPATKIVSRCRYKLLLSCGLSVACFKKLQEGKTIEAVLAYGKSEYYLGTCAATGQAEIGDGSVSAIAAMGARAKLANDPKQKERALVRECWEDWQQEPDRYRGKAAFARDMLSKFESLQSQPVIEGWCRIWERETITQQAQ